MSHFTVTVCLPADSDQSIDERLADVLARWDENVSVAPYKSFEDGGPAEYWWVRSVRSGADSHAALTVKGAEGLARERIGSKLAADAIESHDWTRATRVVEEKRPEWAEDAAWAERLGQNPTWEDVVKLYNEKYHPGNELAIPCEVDPDEVDTERLHFDEETGRAYTWSRYNPDSKWDWWVIGGRWRNKFHAKPGVQASALILSDPHYTEQYIKNEADRPQKWAPNKGLRCDGGPKGLLDFESMRDEKAAEANALFDKWEAICAGTPHAEPWSHFRGLFELGELTIDQAREQYHAQPRVQACRDDEDLKWRDDVVAEFFSGRDEYVATARRDAVPGYALITLDREWVAPGRMGWFGMSTDEGADREVYKAKANEYLESLADDVLIVQIDCHI